MMYKWLPVDSTPNLPPASHTNLGVGGLVFKNDKEILVVSEQHIDYPHWKLPGGYVERGKFSSHSYYTYFCIIMSIVFVSIYHM